MKNSKEIIFNYEIEQEDYDQEEQDILNQYKELVEDNMDSV